MSKKLWLLPLASLAISTAAWADFTCYTDSNGLSYSASDFNEYAAQQDVINECETSADTNYYQCQGNVACQEEMPSPVPVPIPFPNPHPYPGPFPGGPHPGPGPHPDPGHPGGHGPGDGGHGPGPQPGGGEHGPGGHGPHRMDSDE